MTSKFQLDKLQTFIERNEPDNFHRYFVNHEETNDEMVIAWCFLLVVHSSLNDDVSKNNLFLLILKFLGVEGINRTINDLLPLQIAYKSNNLFYFSSLLLNGADPEKKNVVGCSTYSMIINDGNDRFLDFIFKYEQTIIDEMIKKKTPKK